MSAVYTGEVKNGVVVFDEGTPPLPDGTRVSVEPVGAGEAVADLSRRLLSIAGRAKGLPPDLAAQHDHYLHGVPKQ
jgi:hypothetical protein